MQNNSSTILTSNMSDALKAFQKQYPAITSGDIQSFLLGYQAAIDVFIKLELSDTSKSTDTVWEGQGVR